MIKKYTKRLMEMSLQIINMHFVDFNKNKHIRIDRKSKWGNPYPLANKDDEDQRAEVLWKYTLYLLRNHKLLKSIPSLKGKTLACWCFPKKCHGQILGYLVDNPDVIEECKKPNTDREKLAEEIFNKLGWEHKKQYVQTTLQDKWIDLKWDPVNEKYKAES